MTTVGLSQGKYPRMLFRATFLYANMNIMTFSFHLYITDRIPRRCFTSMLLVVI
jgi:hypothetical protein